MNYYWCPGAKRIRGQRMTLLQRLRIWKRRKKQDDLAFLRGSWGL